jgi:hypothetical protein
MLKTELTLKDKFKLEFKECYYGNGIVLEADILEYDKTFGELPDASKKLYFRIGTGPFNYAFPASSAWNNPTPTLDNRFSIKEEAIEKPDNYVCWRLPQHERRLWQAGFPVYFGYVTKEGPIEIEVDNQIADILKKDFD